MQRNAIIDQSSRIIPGSALNPRIVHGKCPEQEKRNESYPTESSGRGNTIPIISTKHKQSNRQTKTSNEHDESKGLQPTEIPHEAIVGILVEYMWELGRIHSGPDTQMFRPRPISEITLSWIQDLLLCCWSLASSYNLCHCLVDLGFGDCIKNIISMSENDY